MYIYKIINKINGKSYIGQTTRSVEERWSDHCCMTKSKHKSVIRLAIQKYSKDNFILEIIDSAQTIEELNQKEIKWINELNTLSPNGYNLDSGGKNKNIHTSTRLKMSIAKIGKTKINSIETRIKISVANLGKSKTAAHRESLKNAKRITHVSVKCINNGNIYTSCAEAGRDLGLTSTQVNKCARGIRKSSKGYKFEVVNAK